MRRAWRFMAASGMVMGAIGLYLHAVGFNEREDTAYRGQRAICAIIIYSEETLRQTPPEAKEDNPQATIRFRTLIRDMRATGVQCPPDKPHEG